MIFILCPICGGRVPLEVEVLQRDLVVYKAQAPHFHEKTEET